MAITTLNFFSENDAAKSVALELHGDLPQGLIAFGSKLQRSVTEYGGRNNRSVQILGETFEPISLRGVWDDRQTGVAGRAQALAAALESLALDGGLIRLEWHSYQVFGLLDFTARYSHTYRVEFEIRFEVLYRERPGFLRVEKYTPPPNDSVSVAQEEAAALRTTIGDAPAARSDSLAVFLLRHLAEIENGISEATSILSDVSARAELSAEIAKRAAASLNRPLDAVAAMRTRTRTATLETISTVPGVAAVAVRRWVDTVDIQAADVRKTVSDLLRSLLEAVNPSADRTYTMRENETLMMVAAREYGDFEMWRILADANGLSSASVASGTVIKIPDLV